MHWDQVGVLEWLSIENLRMLRMSALRMHCYYFISEIECNELIKKFIFINIQIETLRALLIKINKSENSRKIYVLLKII